MPRVGARLAPPVLNPLPLWGFPLGFTHEYRAGLTNLRPASMSVSGICVLCGTGPCKCCGRLSVTPVNPSPFSSRAPAKEWPCCMQSSFQSSLQTTCSSYASFNSLLMCAKLLQSIVTAGGSSFGPLHQPFTHCQRGSGNHGNQSCNFPSLMRLS